MISYTMYAYERKDFISRMLSEIENEHEQKLAREDAAKWLGVPVRHLELEAAHD